MPESLREQYGVSKAPTLLFIADGSHTAYDGALLGCLLASASLSLPGSCCEDGDVLPSSATLHPNMLGTIFDSLAD